MNYLIVSDNLEYKFASLIEAHKNHIQVILHPENIKKKFGIKQNLCDLETKNIEDFIKQTLQIDIDTNLLFELIEDTSSYYSIRDLSTLYFGDHYSQIQMAALLLALAKEKISFDNQQNGYFRKCTLAQCEDRKEQANKQALELAELNSYYEVFSHGNIHSNPNKSSEVISNLSELEIIRLVNRPDKNSSIYKGLTRACLESNLSALELCHKIGLIPNLEDFFVAVFKQDNFPKEFNCPDFSTTDTNNSYPLNDSINVFSIDDANTTEIDDAFSVQLVDSGFVIGIHIAAPALNQKLLSMVTNNISTIYYPGNKITMLSPEIISKYSLDQGETKTVVSIYFNLNSAYEIQSYDSKIEQVVIKDNLRIEHLQSLFNSDNLEIVNGYDYEIELKILYSFANKLEEKRGKPSVNNLAIDYTFSFNKKDQIVITPRLRGNPIDKLVSELMILANCTWGRMLTNAFVPAIYRVKQPNFPVKMTLRPDSHTGLNVDYYTWATSPLRRSADFINQYQIISLVMQSKNYFTSTNQDLLDVVENFDSTYSKYIDFQNKMEKYWSLRYLLQENINELTGTFLFKSRVQLDGIPLEIDTEGIISQKPKGSQVKIRIFNINLAKLSFEFKILN